MAKISLKDVTPIKAIPPQEIEINGKKVLVEQYLPLEKKAAMIERILANSVDETGFISPVRLAVFFRLEIVRCYSNISITDKMMEQPEKLFDQLVMNKVIGAVSCGMPTEEWEHVEKSVNKCAKAVQAYQNSFVGVMKMINKDYDATKLNVDELMATLDQPDKVGLVKEILEKIG